MSGVIGNLRKGIWRFNFFQAFECELDPDVIKGGGIKRAQIVKHEECGNVIMNGLVGLDGETDQHDKT